MSHGKAVWTRMRWAVTGLAEEVAACAPLVTAYRRLTSDPRVAERCGPALAQEACAAMALSRPISETQLETMGQLNLFYRPIRLPVDQWEPIPGLLLWGIGL